MFVPVDFSFPNTPGGAIAPPGEGQGGQMARCPPLYPPLSNFLYISIYLSICVLIKLTFKQKFWLSSSAGSVASSCNPASGKPEFGLV